MSHGDVQVMEDPESWNEWPDYAVQRGWTDGLPVYPPTEEAVGRMLAAVSGAGGDVLGEIPPRFGIATMETVAANCVMAGCRPEYFPIVLSALEGLLDPIFNLQGVQTTTHNCEPLTIVCGPLVEEMGFAIGECAFGGGGSRASATVGRAIRLILWNIGGGRPGDPVRKLYSHPGRYSYMLAESASDSPWHSFSQDRGFGRNENTVTVFACEAPHSLLISVGTDMSPELILDRVADHMAALGSNNSTMQGEQLFVCNPFIAEHLANQGWDKSQVREYLYLKSQRPLREVRPHSAQRPNTSPEYWWSWLPDSVDQANEEALVPTLSGPEALHIVVSGARGRLLALCPSWAHFGGFAVTRTISRN